MKLFFSILLLFFSAFSIMAEEADSFAKAKEMAVELNKPILIDFWSDN